MRVRVLWLPWLGEGLLWAYTGLRFLPNGKELLPTILPEVHVQIPFAPRWAMQSKIARSTTGIEWVCWEKSSFIQLGTKVPFDHPAQSFHWKETPKEDGIETFIGFIGLVHLGLDWGQGPPQGCPEYHWWSPWSWSSAGGGIWGPQPAPCSPAVDSGRGDSALEGSLLALPPNCLYFHLGDQGAPPQGLENSKLRAWGFLLHPLSPHQAYTP